MSLEILPFSSSCEEQVEKYLVSALIFTDDISFPISTPKHPLKARMLVDLTHTNSSVITIVLYNFGLCLRASDYCIRQAKSPSFR
jgi:hypothetical protein